MLLRLSSWYKLETGTSGTNKVVRNNSSNDEIKHTVSNGTGIPRGRGFSGRGAEIRLKSNTIQIQNDEYLGHGIEMNEDETSEKFVRLTTGGTSATKARTSQMTPFRNENTSVG